MTDRFLLGTDHTIVIVFSLVWSIPFLLMLYLFLGTLLNWLFKPNTSTLNTKNAPTVLTLLFFLLLVITLPLFMSFSVLNTTSTEVFIGKTNVYFENIWRQNIGGIAFRDIKEVNTKYVRRRKISISDYSLSLTLRLSSKRSYSYEGKRYEAVINMIIGNEKLTIKFQQKLSEKLRSLGYKITSKTAKIER